MILKLAYAKPNLKALKRLRCWRLLVVLRTSSWSSGDNVRKNRSTCSTNS